MEWRQKVPGGFGERDCEYAVHPLDEDRARKAIKEAKAAGDTFEDVEKEIVWHCYKRITAPGALQEHLARQVTRAKELWGKK